MKTDIRTGNVIKTPHGFICIVTRVTDDDLSWVSFDAENSSGGGKIEDSERDTTCFCNENYDYGNSYDPSCSDCKGTGSYIVKILGYKRCKVLAPNVKTYIIKSLTKNFDW